MKFEIRRAQNGVVLRVGPDFPDAKSEEAVYQERADDEIEAFADFLRCLVDQITSGQGITQGRRKGLHRLTRLSSRQSGFVTLSV
jgi:hypothetical protein